MRRREIITLLGGAALAWPLVARAQQPTMPVIGFLHLTSPETNRENLANFWLGLGDTGYIENKNVTIEYRWAQGRNDQIEYRWAQGRNDQFYWPPRRRGRSRQHLVLVTIKDKAEG